MNFDNIKTIVTHDKCADGRASALILLDVFPGAEVIFCNYNTPEYNDLPATEGMIFCDIVPPAHRVDEFIAVGAIVLDHHKTNKEIVAKFGDNGRFADEATEPGVSGASLAFEVWEKDSCNGAAHNILCDEVKRFAYLASVRDTFTKNQDWNEACAQKEMLLFLSWEQICNASWEALTDRASLTGLVEIGHLLLEKHFEKVQEAIKSSWYLEVSIPNKKLFRLVVTQASTEVANDVCDYIADKADLVIGFGFTAENFKQKMKLSLRSHSGSDFDCSELAKILNGGGHKHAAGGFINLTWDSCQPYEILRIIVRNFLLD